MTALRIRALRHRFGENPLFDDLDLTVQDAEYLVILGESGSGKSTLLQIIAGLIRPNSGEVHISGREVARTPPRHRDVAMVFQGDALYPHMTVREQLSFGSGKRDSGEDERQAVSLARIERLLDRYPETLSGGERKRVALAKAASRRAAIRLWDEPLSAIDPVHRQQLCLDLHAIHRRCGGATLHVTHDGLEAMQMATRIAVLHDGQVRQVDSPEAIYHAPSHVMVFRLLSPLGYHEWSAGSKTACARTTDLTARRVAGHDQGATCDDWHLERGEWRIDARVISDAFTPIGRRITVEAAGQRIVAMASGNETAREGDDVWVSVPADRVHRFDTSGNRTDAP